MVGTEEAEQLWPQVVTSGTGPLSILGLLEAELANLKAPGFCLHLAGCRPFPYRAEIQSMSRTSAKTKASEKRPGTAGATICKHGQDLLDNHHWRIVPNAGAVRFAASVPSAQLLARPEASSPDHSQMSSALVTQLFRPPPGLENACFPHASAGSLGHPQLCQRPCVYMAKVGSCLDGDASA